MKSDIPVVLEMTPEKFSCVQRTLDGVKDTIQKLGIHDGFKKSMVADIKSINSMLSTSTKKEKAPCLIQSKS